uniref:uncharacterized protein LOC120325617 n=1 Tax=Styela clava TaxID=7725 RepID=UPI0019395206|nr:uncharacterized protein LOC120325617 [Styela clava]
METTILFILIYVITSSWCQDETVFHCSPKPGCKIAQCDPVAVGWDSPGFNIDEHLHDKEFPITCKSKNTVSTQNTVNLFPLVSRNILDIGSIKSDLKELEENINDKMKNIDGFGKDESRNSNNKIEEQAKEISNLQTKAIEQSEEMKKLKKDLVEIQEKNKQLEKEMDEQMKTNNEMNEAISRIEQKYAAMERFQRLGPTTRPITRAATTYPTTLRPTPSPGYCTVKFGNMCYFAWMQDKLEITYREAVDICKYRNANVGLPKDEESYNAIVNFFRKKVPAGSREIYIWIRLFVNPKTLRVTPANSFQKWHPGFPTIEYTNVFLGVNAKANDQYQGMRNGEPDWKLDGVICEIPI